jgi:hypothetical protein
VSQSYFGVKRMKSRISEKIQAIHYQGHVDLGIPNPLPLWCSMIRETMCVEVSKLLKPRVPGVDHSRWLIGEAWIVDP